ncbi:MAG: DUF2905 domain-containing protein [Chlorobium sp.]|uniref:DUF2905 domain-containing protein n=1 Tax=Chlorobium sp. TaxID=1095 RepID=UPI001D7593E8|nr:DUF2905 domain-containing protein [Chlorobium sp.]MBN1279466.1 DUF2905 domain-containing protein [Chlorobiaceae bacterium]MCF8216511.1 DUF2905 domain-containing protein [Chlorobium sp.]MCF8271416.1 DUF2905 domain-containing protein [Chlorobium sp.]MCF8287788.1 DUF2905 domain-containing protein [Chlorobium sp.]MCF8291327.1 DUF2905 domain-containing protein [Chlorobium sp.]
MISGTGKFLVVGGLLAMLCGLLMLAAEKAGSTGWLNWFGNLPLDVRIRRDNFQFFFPLGTSILLSVLFSLALFIFNKFIR